MIQRPKGTTDLYGSTLDKIKYVEDLVRIIMNDYRFEEVRTPLFESYDLFSRGVGTGTDIVSKEMYDFYDKGDRHIALRPEGTAPIVRAYIENKWYGPEFPQPLKLYYISPMFRYERPQAGRSREFHQIGAEVFGSNSPIVDAETMALLIDLLKEIGLKNLSLTLNSLGNHEDRVKYRKVLLDYLTPLKDKLSADSQRRFEENPLRVLDSKDKADKEVVKNAPRLLDVINEDSKERFNVVLNLLDRLNIPYTIDHCLVRGLDYYQETIFEVVSDSPAVGANTTICGGGRYNSLVEELGGPKTSAFGFGLGIERLILLIEAENLTLDIDNSVDVYIVKADDSVGTFSFELAQQIRKQGYSVNYAYEKKSVKSQFKQASKQNSKLVIVIGESEQATGKLTIKNMANGKEIEKDKDLIMSEFDSIFNQLTIDSSAIDEFFE